MAKWKLKGGRKDEPAKQSEPTFEFTDKRAASQMVAQTTEGTSEKEESQFLLRFHQIFVPLITIFVIVVVCTAIFFTKPIFIETYDEFVASYKEEWRTTAGLSENKPCVEIITYQQLRGEQSYPRSNKPYLTLGDKIKVSIIPMDKKTVSSQLDNAINQHLEVRKSNAKTKLVRSILKKHFRGKLYKSGTVTIYSYIVSNSNTQRSSRLGRIDPNQQGVTRNSLKYNILTSFAKTQSVHQKDDDRLKYRIDASIRKVEEVKSNIRMIAITTFLLLAFPTANILTRIVLRPLILNNIYY